MSKSIVICGSHLNSGYSGGRYHAWMMGEALSAGGSNVTVWTNARPKYANDFLRCSGHSRIDIHVDPGYRWNPSVEADWVVIVPDMSSPRSHYTRWLDFAARCKARVGLLNFESANFFNAFAPSPRNNHDWDNWRYVSKYCDVILSSTNISNQYAEDYYVESPPHCRFLTCQPSINSVEADLAEPMTDQNRIFAITRFTGSDGAHKGGNELLNMIDESMSGYKLSILVGNRGIPNETKERMKDLAELHSVEIETLEGVSDSEKFRYLKSAKLMLFFSRFEGFGYPPVEAIYCGVPCIASDLQVLREISGNALFYVDPSSPNTVKKIIKESLAGKLPRDKEAYEAVQRLVSFESYINRLESCLGFSDAYGARAIRLFDRKRAAVEMFCARIRAVCKKGIKLMNLALRGLLKRTN